jgi:hypothetical protein
LPWRLLSRRAPAAGSIIVRPRIEFNPIESDALPADRDLREKRPDVGVEAIHVHAEVARCIPQPEKPCRADGSVRALFAVDHSAFVCIPQFWLLS